jgi:PAS domain S-box-containing protein
LHYDLEEVLRRISRLEELESRHKNAERNLCQSEENYRRLFEAAPMAIFVTSEDVILFANPAAAKLVGFPDAQSLQGRSVFDVIHPDSIPLVKTRRKALEESLGSEAPYTQQKWVRADGTVLDVEVNSTGFFYEGKKAIQVFARDITEELKARRSLEVFRDLLDQTNDALFVVDPPTARILDANERASTSLGYTREELLGLTVLDIEELHPDMENWLNHVERLRREGRLLFQGRQKRKDGTAFPVEVSIRHIRRNGEEYLVGVARDMTEHREMEQKLIAAKQDWEDVFDTITDMVTLHDADFNIIRSNRAAEKILGLSALNIGRAKCYESYHGTECPPTGCPSCQCLRTGEPAFFEIYEPHLKMYIEIRAIPRLDKNGKVRGLVHIVRDITQRKATEQELERYRIHLEERVAERTSELQALNAALEQNIKELGLAEEKARKYAAELERSNRELEQFAYIASHDLKDPLLAIAADLKLFERHYADRMDAEGRDLLADAYQSATRMQRLISELLAYSRMKTGARPFGRTDFKRALDTALENLRIQIEQSGAEIFSDVLPILLADPVQIVQLFQNLIGNAIKFRRLDEPPRVRIEAGKRGDEWLFSVRDNGIGIPPGEAREKIFEVFRRLHKKEYPGTGIGLALCKKIVERHGGCIWAESEPGKGSTFHFTIPEK